MFHYNYGRHAAVRGIKTLSGRARITIGAVPVAVALATAGLIAAPASAGTTAGSWTLNPAQTSTTSTSQSTVYQSQVQQPINADGSSSWPSNRGVVPVKFALQQATQTTNTTTVGPVVFQSLLADQGTGTAGQEYSNLIFNPGSSLTLNQITNLAADFQFTTGDCYGGSIRWSIGINDNGTDQTVYVYYGTQQNGGTFTGCQVSTLSDNLTGGSTNVEVEPYDTTNFGGPVYGSWADALSKFGNDPVEYAALVLDGGWHADQVVTLNGAAINDNPWTPQPAGTTTDTVTSSYSPATETTAYIHVYKVSSTDSILADETTVSAQPDSTGVFRVADGMYIYNLALSGYGVGRYEVVMRIGGNDGSYDVSQPGYFGLR